MFKNQRPVFDRGNILKREMLENLCNYPREFLKLYFIDYSDGIISGVELEIDDKNIYVGEGIVKFNEVIYILKQPVKLNYSNNNDDNMVKIKFNGLKEKDNFKIYETQVSLDENAELEGNELELGRFKLRMGARLKNSFDKFEDFRVEYNTLNIINVRYSAPYNHTLHPAIIEEFALTLYNRSDEVIDNVFAAECLNSRMVSRKLIINYINKKLNINGNNYDNKTIYNYLGDILNDLSHTPRQKKKKMKRQQIIVD